jgi:hypothetical protein
MKISAISGIIALSMLATSCQQRAFNASEAQISDGSKGESTGGDSSKPIRFRVTQNMFIDREETGLNVTIAGEVRELRQYDLGDMVRYYTTCGTNKELPRWNGVITMGEMSILELQPSSEPCRK